MENILFGGSWKRRIAVWAAVVIFAAFVWPTPFWYATVGTTLYRVNRFTGETTVIERSTLVQRSTTADAWYK